MCISSGSSDSGRTSHRPSVNLSHEPKARSSETVGSNWSGVVAKGAESDVSCEAHSFVTGRMSGGGSGEKNRQAKHAAILLVNTEFRTSVHPFLFRRRRCSIPLMVNGWWCKCGGSKECR